MTSPRSRRGKTRSYRRFVQLWTNVKRSAAYHGLTVYARSALIELLDRYTGINNGMIGLGARELAAELNCSKDVAARALRELDDAGLARPTTPGVWRGKRAERSRRGFERTPAAQEPHPSGLQAAADSVENNLWTRITQERFVRNLQ
jgi:hypothetical protein